MLRGSMILIIGLSAVFQCVTAYFAFRLVPLTRWRVAWSLVSISLLGTAALKTFRLVQYIQIPETNPLEIYIYGLELAISFLLLIGVYRIRPLFEAARRASDIDAIFIQKSPQGLVIYQDEHIVFANPAFAYLSGYNGPQLYGMTREELVQLFHPSDRDIFQRSLQINGVDTPTLRREMRLQNQRGNVYWVATYSARTVFAGRPALQMTFVNITDRKRIELDLRESERRHRIISQLTSDFIYSAVVDANNRIYTEWVSEPFDRITGYSLNEILALGSTWDVITHPDDKLHALEAHTFALSNQAVVTEYRIISRLGELIWLRDYLQPVWNESEKRVTHLIGAVQDITNRKNSETALKESEARWRGLAENAPTIIATINPQHRITWMNRAINRPLSESIGMDFHTILPANERGKIHRALRQIFTTGAQQHLEIEIPNADGQPAWYEAIIGPIQQEDVITAAILVLTNVTERKNAEEQLKFLSNHDILTGLFNRAFFETEVRRLQKSRHFPVTIVMTDVNNLKNTNDLYGHAAGDELLRSIAQVMRESFRSEDVVARIGGDEFAILLPETSEGAAQTTLNRLREKLDMWNGKSREITLSLSIGSATGQPDELLIDVMKRADNRMYEDKARQKGYNIFLPHNPTDGRI